MDSYSYFEVLRIVYVSKEYMGTVHHENAKYQVQIREG